MSAKSSQFEGTSPVLSYFCIYNTSLLGATEDNAGEQILYYTAAEEIVSTDSKMRQIGLAQALVNFTATFSKSPRKTQSVHSQKNRLIFYQPEPGFWMLMCVELGVLRRQLRDSKGKERLVTEYLDSHLNDTALEAVLKVGYDQFKLLNGTFSSILSGMTSNKLPLKLHPTRHNIRALMHAMEQFFNDWVWRWDFDKLGVMCFDAVFNGVPNKPILRKNYLKINAVEEYLRKELPLAHMLVFAEDACGAGLVYRSAGLDIRDICALRKYIMKRIETHYKNEKGKLNNAGMSKDQNSSPSASTDLTQTLSGLKQLTKSLAQTPFLSYFSSTGSKSTETVNSASHDTPSTMHGAVLVSEVSPANRLPTDVVGLKHGVYSTGIMTASVSSTDEGSSTEADLARVFLSSPASVDGPCEDKQTSPSLHEYYLVLYKHDSGLVWGFLLSKTEEAERLLLDSTFYAQLEQLLYKFDFELLTSAVAEDLKECEQKSLNLGKNYQCLFYDNTTLDVKSTMGASRSTLEEKKPPSQLQTLITNEVFLHLLNIREDFNKKPYCSSEIYSRSTRNLWVAGNRFYHSLADDDTLADNITGADSRDDAQDYTEMYLIAAKKDTTLADVEAALSKVNRNLIRSLHLD